MSFVLLNKSLNLFCLFKEKKKSLNQQIIHLEYVIMLKKHLKYHHTPIQPFFFSRLWKRYYIVVLKFVGFLSFLSYIFYFVINIFTLVTIN